MRAVSTLEVIPLEAIPVIGRNVLALSLPSSAAFHFRPVFDSRLRSGASVQVVFPRKSCQDISYQSFDLPYKRPPFRKAFADLV